jgi:hypothetical protein
MKGMLCLVLAIFGLALASCGELIRNQARETASRDHSCPMESVQIDEDATVARSTAYWINVCGRRRFYVYQEGSPGTGSGRFVDDTQRVSSGR